MHKILIVDDNQTNRILLSKILEDLFFIFEAEDGSEALQLLRQHSDEISAVLLDIVMPNVDGYEVLKEVRKDIHLANIPIIMMTQKSDEGSEIKALKSGASDYVSKPYSPEIIRHRVLNLVSVYEKTAMLDASRYDSLTGLMNRGAFFQKADEMLAAHPPGYFVMSCFDIENFKVINDQYGNDKGDDVLIQIANIFQETAVQIGAECCRVNGDNYAFLYPFSYMDGKIISDTLKKVMILDNTIFPITYSIGRYIADDLSIPSHEMYDRAAIAKISVKGKYDNHIAVYDDSMRKTLLQQQEFTKEMFSALVNKEFQVWYQPQYNHSSKSLVGAEALIRWCHPTRGVLLPESFIQIFERNGFIYEIDKFVWEQVCITLRRWLDKKKKPIPISVNISKYDVLQPNMVEVIKGYLQQYNIPTDLLRMEITESAFSVSDQILGVINQLKELGFIIVIDDFGSGYSSLNTLKDVPADVLKLDMCFLKGKTNLMRGGNILESVVRMAKWLGLSVIGEGVESATQADYLESIGCNYLQGFYYAKAMPIEQYEKFVANCGKEERMLQLETVDMLDNDAFWNPESVETLIFNSYVGGASVFEFYRNRIDILRINARYVSMLGGDEMTSEEALKIAWMDYADEENQRCFMHAIEQSIETGKEVNVEVKLCGIRKEKEEVFLRASMRVIAHSGDRYLFYCVMEDVTDQVKLEEQRRKLIENLPCGAAIYELVDNSIKLLFVNRRYQELLGKKNVESALDVTSMGYIYPEDQKALGAAFRDALRFGGKISCDVRVMHANGSFIPFHMVGNIVKADKTYVYCTYIPITDTELSFSEMLPIALEAMMASATELCYVKDKNLNYICCSHSYAQMVGLDNEKDIIGKTDYDLFESSMARRLRDDDEELLVKGVSIIDKVEHIPSPDAINHYSCSSKHILKDSTGNIIGVYGFGRDITENREAYARLKLLTDSIPGGVAMYEISHGKRRAIYTSEGVYNLLGYTDEEFNELTQYDAMELVIPEDKCIVEEQVKLLLEQGKTVDCECRVRTKSGGIIWFHMYGTLAESDVNGAVLNSVIFDVTEKKKAELKIAANKRAMEIASQSARICFWEYDLEKNEVINDMFQSKPNFGYGTKTGDIPQSLIEDGSVHPHDIDKLKEMYDKMHAGAEKAECTVRFMRYPTGKYEWQHIIYTRIEDENVLEPMIIGFAANVDLEQENRLRYEHELKLRRELIKNSMFYFQYNLTKKVLEEFQFKPGEKTGIKSGMEAGEVLENSILNNVFKDDQELVRNTVLDAALERIYNSGKQNAHVTFRRVISPTEIRWVTIKVSLLEKPNTGEIIAFAYGTDVDRAKKDKLAIETIMDEEIEAVAILNVKSGQAHLVQVKEGSSKIEVDKQYNFEDYYQTIVRKKVIDEDHEECMQFFNIQSLVEQLECVNVVKIMYRIQEDSDHIIRKKSRAFYLDDSKEDIVVIRRDITDLYEEEQRQKRKLQKAIRAANDANNAKSEFLSNMSHDIRTPLNSVMAFSNEEMTQDATEEQLREYLRKIHMSGQYLLGIINDVLDMSKIEQNKMILHEEPYLISEFTQTIENIFGEMCRNKNVDFVIEFNESEYSAFVVDKVRFNQIFVNLLSNAVKFTPPGGKVELRVKNMVSNDTSVSKVRFVVRDSGIGMSEEFLPHAFESFQQEYHRGLKENSQGTGLGLSIVKELVELMDGKIQVASKVNFGTVFTIELPLHWDTSQRIALREENVNEGSLEGMHILLAEDNEINTEIAIALLEKKGCFIDSVVDGKMALNQYLASEESKYDVILMDIRMPIMGGLEAARAIRSSMRADAKTIPIIAMTADVFSDDEKKTREVGMNGHLSKPVDPSEMYRLLAKYVRADNQKEH